MDNSSLDKLFDWSPEKIGWYAEACEYSGNDRNSKLAEAVLRELPPRPHICDFGCGIGALSLVLAEKASHITAVDANSDALDYFRSTVSERGCKNIEIINGDFTLLCPPPEKASCVLLCKAGGNRYLAHARRWTDEKVIIITDIAEKHSFSSEKKADVWNNMDELRAYLRAEGCSFTERVVKTEFGQPLRSFDDALRFVSCYNRRSSGDEIAKILEERLVKTDRADFPLYLPNVKEYLVFSITLS